MKYGCEEIALNKIKRLESYLSEGLPRYQDILEQKNKTMPEAPEGKVLNIEVLALWKVKFLRYSQKDLKVED